MGSERCIEMQWDLHLRSFIYSSSFFVRRMELESTRASYPPQPMQPGSSMAVLHKDSIYAQQTTQQVHGTQSPHLSKLQAGSSLHSAADIGPQAYKRPRLHTDQMRTEPCMPLTVDTQIKQVIGRNVWCRLLCGSLIGGVLSHAICLHVTGQFGSLGAFSCHFKGHEHFIIVEICLLGSPLLVFALCFALKCALRDWCIWTVSCEMHALYSMFYGWDDVPYVVWPLCQSVEIKVLSVSDVGFWLLIILCRCKSFVWTFVKICIFRFMN